MCKQLKIMNDAFLNATKEKDNRLEGLKDFEVEIFIINNKIHCPKIDYYRDAFRLWDLVPMHLGMPNNR